MQFRGRGGAGIYEEELAPPTTLESETNLSWKVKVPKGHSSPIIVDDLIFLTGYETGELIVLTVDRTNGNVEWRQAIPVQDFEKTYHHGPATPTIASDGKRLFAVFGTAGVFAFDLEGSELWRKEWDTLSNLFGTASSPIVVEDKLLVLSSNNDQAVLHALNVIDGTQVWERNGEGPASTWSTPMIWSHGEEKLVLVYEPFHLRALSLENGQELWAIPGLADEPITLPQQSEDLVIVTSYNMGKNKEVIGVPTFAQILEECDKNGDSKLTLDETKANTSVLSRPDADGEGDHPLRIFFRMLDVNKDELIDENEWPKMQGWVDAFKHANGFLALKMSESNEPPTLAWQSETGVPECPTPILQNGLLFAVRNGGVVTVLDSRSGEMHYHKRLVPGGPYYASPVIANGNVYFASARGVISVVTATKNPEVISKNDLDEPIWATPAFDRGAIVIRSEDHLWLFENK